MHVQDRASAVFVIALVGVFVAIIGYGLLFGHSGFISGILATPKPSRRSPRRRPVGRPVRLGGSVGLGGAVGRALGVGGPVGLRGVVRGAQRGAVGRTQRGAVRRAAVRESRGELIASAMDEARDRAGVARARMVADQLLARDITDPRVIAAMDAVPREAFVSARDRAHAYEDHPLSIGAGQTISQPYIVARMTQLLAVERGDRVLDVGTGSGYQAAILGGAGLPRDLGRA